MEGRLGRFIGRMRHTETPRVQEETKAPISLESYRAKRAKENLDDLGLGSEAMTIIDQTIDVSRKAATITEAGKWKMAILIADIPVEIEQKILEAKKEIDGIERDLHHVEDCEDDKD